MKEGILTVEGIVFLSAEITALLSASTNVVASPIPIPFIADEVTARVGHIPIIRTSVGFSTTSPLKNLSAGVFCLKPKAPFFASIAYHCPPFNTLSKYETDAFTPFVIAFDVMVAPEIASICVFASVTCPLLATVKVPAALSTN